MIGTIYASGDLSILIYADCRRKASRTLLGVLNCAPVFKRSPCGSSAPLECPVSVPSHKIARRNHFLSRSTSSAASNISLNHNLDRELQIPLSDLRHRSGRARGKISATPQICSRGLSFDEASPHALATNFYLTPNHQTKVVA